MYKRFSNLRRVVTPSHCRRFYSIDNKFNVDRTALDARRPYTADVAANKEPETPLATHLKTKIKIRGPISVGSFMNEALLNPEYGYYSTANKRKQQQQQQLKQLLQQQQTSTTNTPQQQQEQQQQQQSIFGSEGDFITSPEISQMFGELIGVWCVSMWEKLGSPSKVHIVEFGPGTGTLMSDLLRAASKFPGFCKAATAHLIDASPSLRELQHSKLKVSDVDASVLKADEERLRSRESEHDDSNRSGSTAATATATTTAATTAATAASAGPMGLAGRSGFLSSDDAATVARSEKKPSTAAAATTNQFPACVESHGGVQVFWRRELTEVPEDGVVLIIAQEFFDALPVFQFEYTESGWRELLVDVDDSTETAEHFRLVRAPAESVSTRLLIAQSAAKGIHIPQNPKVGDRIELCPVAASFAEFMAQRMSTNGGAALIIDYGEDRLMPPTLQGIRSHTFCNIFSSPGTIDLSCYVDFSAIRRAVSTFNNVRVFGPETQQRFLYQMGIDSRLLMLLKNPALSESQVETLITSYQRLVDPSEMGERYKVMCLLAETNNNNNSTPAGFEFA